MSDITANNLAALGAAATAGVSVVAVVGVAYIVATPTVGVAIMAIGLVAAAFLTIGVYSAIPLMLQRDGIQWNTFLDKYQDNLSSIIRAIFQRNS